MIFLRQNKKSEQGMANFFGFIFILCIILFTVVSIFLLGITPLRQLSQRNSLEKQTNILVNELENNALSGATKLLQALAVTDEVKSFILWNKNAEEVKVAINLAKNILDASLVYILDNEGNVVASTTFIDSDGRNCNLEGNNYSFRPYFTRAMSGQSVTYSAVGVTTGKRGIYLSWPVKVSNQTVPCGVIVIKLGLENVDSALNGMKEKALLFNSEQVVFATNVPEWMYNLNIYSLDSNDLRLNRDRQFNQLIIDTLPFDINTDNVDINDTTYLLESETLPSLNWKIVLLAQENSNFPLNKYFIKLIIITVTVILLLGFIILFLLYVIKRKKKAEIELRLHKENLKITLDSIGDGVIAIDNRNFIVEINTVATKLTEFTEQEAIGQKLKNIFRAVKSGTYKPIIDLLGEGNNNDLILLSKSNKEIEISNLATPIKNSENEILGIVIVFRDITDQKETKLKLKKQYEQTKLALQKAEENDKLKTAFLQNISHEIRTPLNGIIGFSELLSLTDNNVEMDRYRKHIVENGEYLIEIIQDVIEVSKFEAGQVDVKIEAFDLNKGLRNIYKRFVLVSNAQNIELKLNVLAENDICMIKTDGRKLLKVFVNLLDNAFKFTNNGLIEFGYTVGNKEYKFFVKDSGIGISKEQHNKIFSGFSQLSTKKYQTQKGMGIGLTLAQKYVHLLEGTIWLESKVNEGTTFYFTIPKKQNAK